MSVKNVMKRGNITRRKMKSVEYSQGMTKVYCDKDKVVITNPSGTSHLEANVDEIFGVGEYNKIFAVNYTYDVVRSKFNPHSSRVELVSGYIPLRARQDLNMEKSLPGLSSLFDKDKY